MVLNKMNPAEKMQAWFKGIYKWQKAIMCWQNSKSVKGQGKNEHSFLYYLSLQEKYWQKILQGDKQVIGLNICEEEYKLKIVCR